MGGYEMLVRGEPMRARFRKSHERPEPMPPNKVEKIEYVMPDVNHTFMKGHRTVYGGNSPAGNGRPEVASFNRAEAV